MSSDVKSQPSSLAQRIIIHSPQSFANWLPRTFEPKAHFNHHGGASCLALVARSTEPVQREGSIRLQGDRHEQLAIRLSAGPGRPAAAPAAADDWTHSKYGPAGEIGAANLSQPETVVDAVKLVTAARPIHLGSPHLPLACCRSYIHVSLAQRLVFRPSLKALVGEIYEGLLDHSRYGSWR